MDGLVDDVIGVLLEEGGGLFLADRGEVLGTANRLFVTMMMRFVVVVNVKSSHVESFVTRGERCE